MTSFIYSKKQTKIQAKKQPKKQTKIQAKKQLKKQTKKQTKKQSKKTYSKKQTKKQTKKTYSKKNNRMGAGLDFFGYKGLKAANLETKSDGNIIYKNINYIVLNNLYDLIFPPPLFHTSRLYSQSSVLGASAKRKLDKWKENKKEWICKNIKEKSFKIFILPNNRIGITITSDIFDLLIKNFFGFITGKIVKAYVGLKIKQISFSFSLSNDGIELNRALENDDVDMHTRYVFYNILKTIRVRPIEYFIQNEIKKSIKQQGGSHQSDQWEITDNKVTKIGISWADINKLLNNFISRLLISLFSPLLNICADDSDNVAVKRIATPDYIDSLKLGEHLDKVKEVHAKLFA